VRLTILRLRGELAIALLEELVALELQRLAVERGELHDDAVREN